MTDHNQQKILIIDDESSIRKFLRHSISSQGFEVIEAETGREGIQKMIERKPDLVILDYGLPDILGIEVLKKIREWSKVPIIFLTARDNDADKVEALDQGADDYLTKPFSVPELMARIRVALRHIQIEPAKSLFTNGKLQIDYSAHVVKVDQKEVKFTATEYSLLSLLAKHVGKLLSHRMILKEIWGPNSVEHDHYLRVYFSQIRKKLDAAYPEISDMIENESGVGYRLKHL